MPTTTSKTDAPADAPAAPDDETQLSRQAQFSTYKENTDVPEQNPPGGPHVLQERGKAKES